MLSWTRIDANASTDRADFIRKWTQDLFDPTLSQAKSRLMNRRGSMCCLGVASNKTAKLPKKLEGNYYSFESEDSYLPYTLQEFLGMQETGDILKEWKEYNKEDAIKLKELINKNYNLANANDSKVPFAVIAKAIILYPAAFFKELTKEEEEYIKQSPIVEYEEIRRLRKELKQKKSVTNE